MVFEMEEPNLFKAYCDASGIFSHKFQSIGVVSGSDDKLGKLRSALASIINTYEVRELKFAEISKCDSQDYKAALEAINLVTSTFCGRNRIRIDVMTWNTTDSRHAIPGRNDVENLGRLYYHLLLNVTQRWSQGEWDVVIDKNEKVDFVVLKDCINCKLPPMVSGTLPEIIESTSQLESLNVVKNIREVESHEEPLVQLADLFAGLARFSHEQGVECCKWLSNKRNPEQLPLSDFVVDEGQEKKFSKTTECRFQLVGEVNKLCKKYRLGVSLETEKRLWTPNPINPLNFWLYAPQGSYDKAPIG
jgi:hypothetical protein